MHRRSFLKAGAVTVGAIAMQPTVFLRRIQRSECSADGPYGPLGPPDDNDIRLPAGFRSRLLARSGDTVGTTSLVWHDSPDGGGVIALAGGGWAYVSNSERNDGKGGAASLVFDRWGNVVDAVQILSNTTMNCAGGVTPWGTWLSCEEADAGYVWECQPLVSLPVRRDGMGVFKHEAAAVDDVRRAVYMSEDVPDGGFYRFRYLNDLSSGTLEIARLTGPTVTWTPVPDPSGARGPTRHQVPAAARFDGGEGVSYGNGFVYFTTKGDNRVWRYDVLREQIVVLYDDGSSCNPVLTGVDDVMVSAADEVFVAEDHGNMQLVLLTPDGAVAPFLQILGHDTSEIAGLALNPSGDRMYVSSQRGSDGRGLTYEITGPFRTQTIL